MGSVVRKVLVWMLVCRWVIVECIFLRWVFWELMLFSMCSWCVWLCSFYSCNWKWCLVLFMLWLVMYLKVLCVLMM